MRRMVFCVPMISLLLLTGCGGGGGGVSQAEQQALQIRGEYLELDACTAHGTITADYGQRVYQYEIEAAVEGETTTLTVTAPETVAGIKARIEGKDSFLEYEELMLETGPMDEAGLSPVSSIPVLLECARSGYITACSITDEGLLRVDCGDPEQAPGQGRAQSLWFDPDSHGLRRGEISVDGVLVITCEFTDFTMG